MRERDLLIVLGLLAFLPPLLFMLWVRNSERHQREPLMAVLGLFLYSATIGIAFALLLNEFLVFSTMMWAAVVAAPLIEEATKGMGLRFVRHRILEVEDGIVYGATLGLGFAATENFLYGYYALQTSGATAALTITVARIFSSMLLHASTSALLGLGAALLILGKRHVSLLILFYAISVGLHALYNYLVLSQTWIGFVVGIGMVIVLSQMMRLRVKALDAKGRPVTP